MAVDEKVRKDKWVELEEGLWGLGEPMDDTIKNLKAQVRQIGDREWQWTVLMDKNGFLAEKDRPVGTRGSYADAVGDAEKYILES